MKKRVITLKQNRWYEVEIYDLTGHLLEKVRFFAEEKTQESGLLGQGNVKESFRVSQFSRIVQ